MILMIPWVAEHCGSRTLWFRWESPCHISLVSQGVATMAGFKPNSEIIGNFRKIENFYGHLIQRQKF